MYTAPLYALVVVSLGVGWLVTVDFTVTIKGGVDKIGVVSEVCEGSCQLTVAVVA